MVRSNHDSDVLLRESPPAVRTVPVWDRSRNRFRDVDPADRSDPLRRAARAIDQVIAIDSRPDDPPTFGGPLRRGSRPNHEERSS